MKKIAFTTLGCRLNQQESVEMEESLGREYEVVPFTSEAGIYVINTCTVTGKSDHKCRQIIRSTAKRAPDSKIIVTGCYAETKPGEISKMAGVSLVVGNLAKSDILSLIRKLNNCEQAAEQPLFISGDDNVRAFKNGLLRTSRQRTAAYLKIQTGCDMSCSYCIVTIARGEGRSNPVERIKKEVANLTGQGVNEIVLTGINLGCYGRDLAPKVSIAALLSELQLIAGVKRIRLSSINPNEVSVELVDLIKNSSVICKHLHIPLQSGDNGILTKMRRNYTVEKFRALVQTLHQQIDGIAVGTDIIVGFPGESEDAFLNTYNLIKELPLSYLHIFRYSQRDGTDAAKFSGHVLNAVKTERSKRMIELGAEKKESFRKKYLNQVVNVLFETGNGKPAEALAGYTDNYIPVVVEGPDTLKNTITKVKLIELGPDRVRGVLVNL